MGKKENMSDMFIDKFYTDKDTFGNYVNKVGKVLKFMYEGSATYIKITRIDRKNKRCWGEHIKLYDFNNGMSHYGHDVDTSDMEHVYCRDCDVEIDQPNTEEGEVKAIERQKREALAEEKKDAKRDKDRRFRYELLKQDGTIVKFPARRRMKVGEIMKKLNQPEELGVIPAAYYPQEYAEAAIYSDQKANWHADAIKNPHLVSFAGDPDLGEPEELYIVGDALAEIEVFDA